MARKRQFCKYFTRFGKSSKCSINGMRDLGNEHKKEQDQKEKGYDKIAFFSLFLYPSKL